MIWGFLVIIGLAITPLMWKYTWFRRTVIIAVPLLMMASMMVMKVAIVAMRIVLFVLAPTVGRRTDGSLPPERMYSRW